ncbi:hypothetical protein NUW54_g2842 [Trametes sanguinea]|uniref:Uncharacterized protein n=1 Tax=Trametes sanguinea TaxID=158606 RepID=A0ACC1Q2E8_9APHY|nr:hypothetical protein NUW54_g2842 [Trametes sanguinea]
MAETEPSYFRTGRIHQFAPPPAGTSEPRSVLGACTAANKRFVRLHDAWLGTDAIGSYKRQLRRINQYVPSPPNSPRASGQHELNSALVYPGLSNSQHFPIRSGSDQRRFASDIFASFPHSIDTQQQGFDTSWLSQGQVRVIMLPAGYQSRDGQWPPFAVRKNLRLGGSPNRYPIAHLLQIALLAFHDQYAASSLGKDVWMQAVAPFPTPVHMTMHLDVVR